MVYYFYLSILIRDYISYVLLACVAVEDGGFFFALATAPAHVEDKLDDAWVEFARQTVPTDNPAGDPPEVRTGEQPNAASVTGVSLTEEAQAQEIKEGEEIKQMHWQSFFGVHAEHWEWIGS